MSETLYDKIIYENPDKGYQYRLVVSDFRGEQYLHVRKYFQTYEGDFVPSKEGATFIASMDNIYALLDGLIELTSKAESVESVTQHFRDKIKDLNISA
jgi:hypothetical protein